MQKLKQVLQSRKFWALVAALVTIAAGYFTQGIDMWQAIQAVVASLAAYAIGTGLDNPPTELL
jgi:hypothetical protein